jgi:thiol-disulfide isomerase/thioredoxin
VDASPYSTLLGIPVSLLGLMGYGLILLLVLWPGFSQTRRLALHLTVVAGFSFTLYLVYLQWWVIKAFCPYCVVSTVVISAILGVVLKSKVTLPGTPPGRLGVLSLGLAVVVVLGASLAPTSFSSPVQQGPDVADFPAALAKHLRHSGVVMYGAYWCPHCRDQKEWFGEAFEYISYVECDPRGKGGNPTLCQEKGISGYPTWEIGEKFYEGAYPLQVLAVLSGYRP